jgi:radical SAM superfamily enzyme with C-terminal helix-hairpin-helix motif
MQELDLNKLKSLYERYEAPWKEVNIFGIRNQKLYSKDSALDIILSTVDSIVKEEDLFDDTIGIATNDFIKCYSGTTDPGRYFTLNPTTYEGVTGAAHLLHGFHDSAWCVGIHAKGTSFAHQALIQVGNKVSFWRDVNKNGIYDEGIDVIQDGFIGLNIHRSALSDPDRIGFYSAGCQTMQKHLDFLEFMSIITSSNSYLQNNKYRFSYLLLDLGDIS